MAIGTSAENRLAGGDAELDDLAVPVVLVDAAGTVCGANAEARLLFGKAINASGIAWREWLHPADAARAGAAWRRASRRGSAFEVALRFRRGTGWSWMLCRATPRLTGFPRRVVCTPLAPQRMAEEAAETARARARLLEDATGIGSWELDFGSGAVRLSPTACALQSLPFPPAPEAASFGSWLSRLHPDDREGAAAHVAAALRDGTPLRHEFRVVRPDGGWRWLEARGQRLGGADGAPPRLIGVDMDITARKVAEATAQLSLREVEHRAKNALATAQALVRLTRAESPRDFARSVDQRLAALGRAHARLSAAPFGGGVALRPVVEAEFAPYEGRSRVTLHGPAVLLGAGAVQPLCMALHELVTNTAKYGALSRPGSRVRVSWRRRDGGLVLSWRESGGPRLDAPPQRRGFGLSMLDALIVGQLGGTLRLRWAGAGLRALLCLPAGCVAAD